jgi:RimJ/RimL family protein N-acetyltransferase
MEEMTMSNMTQPLRSTCIPGKLGGLRPLELARDASPIYQLSHDRDVDQTWQEMKVGPFPNEAAFHEHVTELLSDPNRAFFAVVGPDDRALGWLCLMEASAVHQYIELGYVLFPPVIQRTTLATEAFLLILSHVFDDLAYRRLEWTCTADNDRSRRAADRLGFSFEGIMRQKLVLKGQCRDIAMYAMLSEEWPVRKQAMIDWLDPSNFDQGRQRESLKHTRRLCQTNPA